MRRPDPWFRFAEFVVRPPIAVWFNWRFEGMEHVPADGPVLVACNHISHLDPFAHAYALVRSGRRPRFLAKSELFGNAVLSRVLSGAGQIPVERGSGSPAPLESAKLALKRGEAVVVYPEGTITRNSDFSPMRGTTGVARLTLETGVPVLPLAVWGPQAVWQREGLRDVRFGRPIWVKAGAPLDFSDSDGGRSDPEVLREVTDAIVDELTRLVNDLRNRYPKRWSA